MQNVSNLVIPEGEVRTIHDEDSRLLWGRVSYSVKYSGDAVQDGTPTPDSPVSVQTVAGTQVVSIADGTNTQNFTVDLGSIELCKIGTYQDYIYKSGDDWYVHKAVGKKEILSVNSIYSSAGVGYIGAQVNVTEMLSNSRTNGYSNRFTPINSPSGATTEGITFGAGNKTIYIVLKDSRMESSTGANWNAWLASNNTIVYYPLATPTDTQITDNTLIGQLNDVHEWLTRYGYNATVTGNLPIIIDKTNL